MKMNPPTKLFFWISVVLAVLGLLGTFVTIPFVSAFAFWFVVVGYVVLVASLFVKGM
jgi:heme/copper-type cytochrome/quinol oxidase subunit 1